LNIWQAIALGIVQGITEFFPISSSGHLVLLQGLFGFSEPKIAFDIFLHVGSLVSIFIFFRKDIIELFKNRRLFALIMTASIPTFFIGYFMKDMAESLFAAPKTVGWMLAATGVFLLTASIYSKHSAGQKEPGLLSSLIVGVAQGIAVIPGISRSGATIGSAILCGMKKEEAVRFSFLLAIPAILGASVFKMSDITGGLSGKESLAFFMGALAACITGVIAIKVLLELVKGNRLYIFGLYCIAVGAVTIIFI